MENPSYERYLQEIPCHALIERADINDEWCAASEHGRNAARPASNGTGGGKQLLPSHRSL